MVDSARVRALVHGAVTEVLAQKGVVTQVIVDEAVLGGEGLGLDSLDMATVAAILEDQTGKDPFASGRAAFSTVGDLVSLYQA